MRYWSVFAALVIPLLAAVPQTSAQAPGRNIVVTVWVERESDSKTVKTYEVTTIDGGPKTSVDATERIPMGGATQGPGTPTVVMTTQTVGFKGEFLAQTTGDNLIRLEGEVSDSRPPAADGTSRAFHHAFQILLKDGVPQDVLKFDDPNAGKAVLKVRAVAQMVENQPRQ